VGVRAGIKSAKVGWKKLRNLGWDGLRMEKVWTEYKVEVVQIKKGL